MNPSTAQARVLVDALADHGVEHVVACPGSRNAPLAFALHDAARRGLLTVHVRIDERSAAFLALGLAASTGRPVAVSCTSGTAAANFHPAVAEADRAGVGLVVLTADRPPELRAAGANQVIDQYRLYGTAVRHFEELAVAERRAGQVAYWRSAVGRAVRAAASGPVQLNLPFREPLVPGAADEPWPEPLAGGDVVPPERVGTVEPVRPDGTRGLVLLSPGVGDTGPTLDWAARHGWPVISETGGAGVAGPTVLRTGPWLLGDPAFAGSHRPDVVLAVGRPTVFRQFRALLSDPDVRVLRCEHGLGDPVSPAAPDWLARWQAADGTAAAALDTALAAAPWHTGMNVAATMLNALPRDAALTVGSSNPTRDVALAAVPRGDLLVHRNRGASGIDGTLSTAAGVALGSGRPGYALLGDLTFLHDVNGLLIGPEEPRPDLTVLVLNDDGGGIFSLLEQGEPAYERSFSRMFGTPHGSDLAALCAGYGVEHTLAADQDALRAALAPAPGRRVVEVRTSRSPLRALHAAARSAVATALRH